MVAQPMMSIQLADGVLRVLKEIEHGPEELAALGERSGELLGIKPGRSVRERNDVEASSKAPSVVRY